VGAGWPFAFERYQTEQPTEAVARGFLDAVLRQPVAAWRQAMPGCEKHMILCLGILSAPHESQNVHPTANFKTYLDMQFHLIANDPVFYGARGLMTYLSSYADEEIIRWVSRLYRHYGIEGRTERLSKDPYALTHIANPDFDDGTRGWTIAPAEDGSIATKSFNGLSWLQGRYPRTSQGDNFLWMKRSAKRPNVVSQPIKDLRPGRLYSLKMMSADYRDLVEGKSAKQKHAVSITLDGVELSRAKCFQHVFANNYAHHLGPFNRDHKFWMNYHRLVFRAKGKTARFSISDWATGRDPGGPVGQELALNFLEVQPYLGD
jgi:hypothetical protein